MPPDDSVVGENFGAAAVTEDVVLNCHSVVSDEDGEEVRSEVVINPTLEYKTGSKDEGSGCTVCHVTGHIGRAETDGGHYDVSSASPPEIMSESGPLVHASHEGTGVGDGPTRSDFEFVGEEIFSTQNCQNK